MGFGVVLMLAAPPLGNQLGLVVLLASQAMIGTGAGIYFAVDYALTIEVLPDRSVAAKDLGVMNIAQALPQSVAPFLTGAVFLPLGNVLFPTFPGGGYVLSFLFAGVIGVIGGLMVYKIRGVK